MKKWSILLLLNICLIGYSFAQANLKAGVHLAVPAGIYFSLEYPFSSRYSVEVGSSVSYSRSENIGRFQGTTILMSGRRNLFPKRRRLNTYIGVYLRTFYGVENERIFSFGFTPTSSFTSPTIILRRVSGVSTGIMVGRKFYQSKKVFFEFNVGIGRRWVSEVFDDKSTRPRFSNLSLDGMINLVAGYKL